MLFSVIVTALNAGEKLMQTVDSVLSQSFPDYEIIVQDGGSKDGSADFLDAPEYAQDGRIRLFSEPDTGIYDGMNKAIGRIRGSFVLFLNCGDLMYDDIGSGLEVNRLRNEKRDLLEALEMYVKVFFLGLEESSDGEDE